MYVSISQYTFVLLIVFLLEAIIGGLAYVYERHITDELSQTLNETFLKGYGVDERQTNAIDRMQQEVNKNIQMWLVSIHKT